VTTEALHELIAGYGLPVLFLLVMAESAGLPLPGETALVTAALYAGSTGNLSLTAVIATAAAGAIAGDNLGYLAGRRFGRALVTRYGPRVGLTPPRWRLARYLVDRYGVYAVFGGRFVAILRSLAAVVAGAAQMPWLRFFLANAIGGIAWAGVYGLAAHSVGQVLHRLSPAELALLASGGLALFLLTGHAIDRRREGWQREANRLYDAGDAS
jgi:membrane protein DedA with SNARE-associated domain